MNRVQVRRAATMRRRPLRAHRLAVSHDKPMEYSTPSPAPRWLVIGAGALGLGVVAEMLVGLAVGW